VSRNCPRFGHVRPESGHAGSDIARSGRGELARFLVDRVHHWPGVNGLPELLAGRCLRATRPLHFFRPDGPMPEAVEMRLTIPPELGPEAELLAELRTRVPRP
jgi:hypothetical protein